MSLEGAKCICLDEAGNHGEIVVAKGRKFSMGYYVSCDLVLDDERAKGVHCEIECDAFGRVSIRNFSPDKPILVNGSSVEIKRILLNNSKLSILDKEYLWQFPRSSSNEFEDLNSETVSTPQKQIGIPEQAPNSCPDFKLHRELPKRFTVHNFAYCIQSDEEGNTSADSNECSITGDEEDKNRNEIKDQKEASTSENQSNKDNVQSIEEDNLNGNGNRSVTPEPLMKMDNSKALLETPKMNLINCTNDKENNSTQKKNKQLLTLCQPSHVVITSFSPRETGVKVEKSFTAIIKPKVQVTKLATTPRSVYSTPKSDMDVDDDGDDREIMQFHTPSTSKKAAGSTASKVLKNSSMHLVDLTTPHKLRPGSPLLKSALKASTKKNLTEATDTPSAKLAVDEQLGLSALPSTPLLDNCNKSDLKTPSSVISVSSTDSSSVVEVTSDGSELGITPSSSTGLNTPMKSHARAGACTPKRTPQSLMKRALLTSAKKQATTPQRGTSVATTTTPRRESINRIPLRSNLALLGSPVTPKVDKNESQLPRRLSMSTPTRKSITSRNRFDNSPNTSNFNASSPSSSSRRSFINPMSANRALPTSTPLTGSSNNSSFRNRAACKTSPLHKVRKSVGGIPLSSHISKARKSLALPATSSKLTSVREKSPQQVVSGRLVSRARKSFCTTPISTRAQNMVRAAKTPPSILKDKQIERKPAEQRKAVLFADKLPPEGGAMDDLSRTFIVDSDEEEEGENEKDKPKDATFSPEKEKNIDETDKVSTTTINTTFSPEKKTDIKENLPKALNEEKDDLIKTIEIPVDVEEIASSKEEKMTAKDTGETNDGNQKTKTNENNSENKDTNNDLAEENKEERKNEKQCDTAEERNDENKEIINQKYSTTDKEDNKKDNNKDSRVTEESFAEVINAANVNESLEILECPCESSETAIIIDAKVDDNEDIFDTSNGKEFIDITEGGPRESSQTESQESFGDVVSITQDEIEEERLAHKEAQPNSRAEETTESHKESLEKSNETPHKNKLAEEAQVSEIGFGEESIVGILETVNPEDNAIREVKANKTGTSDDQTKPEIIVLIEDDIVADNIETKTDSESKIIQYSASGELTIDEVQVLDESDISINEQKDHVAQKIETEPNVCKDDETKPETINLTGEDNVAENIETTSETESNVDIVQESKLMEHLASEENTIDEVQVLDDSVIIINDQKDVAENIDDQTKPEPNVLTEEDNVVVNIEPKTETESMVDIGQEVQITEHLRSEEKTIDEVQVLDDSEINIIEQKDQVAENFESKTETESNEGIVKEDNITEQLPSEEKTIDEVQVFDHSELKINEDKNELVVDENIHVEDDEKPEVYKPIYEDITLEGSLIEKETKDLEEHKPIKQPQYEDITLEGSLIEETEKSECNLQEIPEQTENKICQDTPKDSENVEFEESTEDKICQETPKDTVQEPIEECIELHETETEAKANTDNITKTSSNNPENVVQMEEEEEPLTRNNKIEDHNLSEQEDTNENQKTTKDSQIVDQFELKDTNKAHKETVNKIALEEDLQDLHRSEMETDANTSKLLEEIEDVLNKSDEIKLKHFEEMQSLESETPLTEEFECEETNLSETEQNERESTLDKNPKESENVEPKDQEIVAKITNTDIEIRESQSHASAKTEHENSPENLKQSQDQFPTEIENREIVAEAEAQSEEIVTEIKLQTQLVPTEMENPEIVAKAEAQSAEIVAETKSQSPGVVAEIEAESQKMLDCEVIPETENKITEDIPTSVSSIKKKNENTTTPRRTRRSSLTAEATTSQAAASSLTPKRSTRRTSLSAEISSTPVEATLTPRRSARRASSESTNTCTPTKVATRRASLSATNETALTPKRVSSRRSSISDDKPLQPVLEVKTPRAKTPRKLLEQRKAEEKAEDMDAIIEEEEDVPTVQKVTSNKETISEEVLKDVAKETHISTSKKELENVAAEILKSEEENVTEKRSEELVLELKIKDVADEIDILEIKVNENTDDDVLKTEETNMDALETKPEIDENLEITKKEAVLSSALTDEVVSVETALNEDQKSVENFKEHVDDKSLLNEDNAIIMTNESKETNELSDDQAIEEIASISDNVMITNDSEDMAETVVILDKIEMESISVSEITKTDKDIEAVVDETVAMLDDQSAEELRNKIMESKEISTPKAKKSVKIVADSPKTPVMTGMRELLKTPKAELNTPKYVGLSDLVRTPKVKSEHEEEEDDGEKLAVLAELVKTPKVEISNQITTNVHEVSTPKTKKLLKTELKVESSEEEEVDLVEAPKNENILDEIEPEEIATTSIISTPKTKKSVKHLIADSPKTPIMTGMRELLKTPKADKTPKFAGIRNLVQTPKQLIENEQEECEKLAGVVDMVKTPQTKISQNLVAERLEEMPTTSAKDANLRGVKELLRTPKSCSTPRFKGMRELMQTPKICSTPLMGGIKELMNSPTKMDNENMDKFLKTPTAKNIMIPSLPSSAVIEKSTDSIEVSTEYDLNVTHEGELTNLEELFKTPVASRFAERITASYYGEEEGKDIDEAEKETLQEKLNESAEEAFDELTAQESQIQTPLRKIYNRKSFGLQTPQAQSPFSTADVLSDLPKTDVEEWIETLDQAETPIVVEDDDDANVVVGEEIVLDDDISYLEDSLVDKNESLTNDESIIPETCAKVYLSEKCLANVTSSSEVMLNLSSIKQTTSKDPLAKTTTKILPKVTRPVTPMDAEISGIDLLDQTMESIQDEQLSMLEEPLVMEEASMFDEHLVVSDNESDADVTVNNAKEIKEEQDSLANETLGACEEDENDLSEPLLVSDSEDLNHSLELKEAAGNKTTDQLLEENNSQEENETTSLHTKNVDIFNTNNDPLESELVIVQDQLVDIIDLETSEIDDDSSKESTEDNKSVNKKPKSTNDDTDIEKASSPVEDMVETVIIEDDVIEIEDETEIIANSLIEDDVSSACQEIPPTLRTNEKSVIMEEDSKQDSNNLDVSLIEVVDSNEDSESNTKSLTDNAPIIHTQDIDNSLLEDSIIEDSFTESKPDDGKSRAEIIVSLHETTSVPETKQKEEDTETSEIVDNKKDNTTDETTNENTTKSETLMETKELASEVINTKAENLSSTSAEKSSENVDIENVDEILTTDETLELSEILEKEIENEETEKEDIVNVDVILETDKTPELSEILEKVESSEKEDIENVAETLATDEIIEPSKILEKEIENEELESAEASEKEDIENVVETLTTSETLEPSEILENEIENEELESAEASEKEDMENVVETVTTGETLEPSVILEKEIDQEKKLEVSNKEIRKSDDIFMDDSVNEISNENIEITVGTTSSNKTELTESRIECDQESEDIFMDSSVNENSKVDDSFADKATNDEKDVENESAMVEVTTKEMALNDAETELTSSEADVAIENQIVPKKEDLSEEDVKVNENVKVVPSNEVQELCVKNEQQLEEITEEEKHIDSEIVKQQLREESNVDPASASVEEISETEKEVKIEMISLDQPTNATVENVTENIKEDDQQISQDQPTSTTCEVIDEPKENVEENIKDDESAVSRINKDTCEDVEKSITESISPDISEPESCETKIITKSEDKVSIEILETTAEPTNQSTPAQTESELSKDILESKNKLEETIEEDQLEEPVLLHSPSTEANDLDIETTEDIKPFEKKTETTQESSMVDIEKSLENAKQDLTTSEESKEESTLKSIDQVISKPIEEQTQQTDVPKTVKLQYALGEIIDKDPQNSEKVKTSTKDDISFNERNNELVKESTKAETSTDQIAEIIQTYDFEVKISDTESKSDNSELQTDNISTNCSNAELELTTKHDHDSKATAQTVEKSKEEERQSNVAIEQLVEDKKHLIEVTESINKEAEITVKEATVCMPEDKEKARPRRKRTASDSSQGSVHEEDNKSTVRRGRRKVQKTPVEETLVEEIKEKEEHPAVPKQKEPLVEQEGEYIELPAYSNHIEVKTTLTEQETEVSYALNLEDVKPNLTPDTLETIEDEAIEKAKEKAPDILEAFEPEAVEKSKEQVVKRARRKPTVSESSQGSVNDDDSSTRKGRRKVQKTQVEPTLFEESRANEVLSNVSTPVEEIKGGGEAQQGELAKVSMQEEEILLQNDKAEEQLKEDPNERNDVQSESQEDRKEHAIKRGRQKKTVSESSQGSGNGDDITHSQRAPRKVQKTRVEEPLVEEELPTTSNANIVEKEENLATISPTNDELVIQSNLSEELPNVSTPAEEIKEHKEDAHKVEVSIVPTPEKENSALLLQNTKAEELLAEVPKETKVPVESLEEIPTTSTVHIAEKEVTPFSAAPDNDEQVIEPTIANEILVPNVEVKESLNEEKPELESVTISTAPDEIKEETIVKHKEEEHKVELPLIPTQEEETNEILLENAKAEKQLAQVPNETKEVQVQSLEETKEHEVKRGRRKQTASESSQASVNSDDTTHSQRGRRKVQKTRVEEPLVEEKVSTISTACIAEKEEKPATVSTSKEETVTESLIVEKQELSSGLLQEEVKEEDESSKVQEETHVPAKASVDAIKQTVRHGRRKQTVSESSQDSTHDEETATRRGRRRVLKTPVDKPLVEEKHESEKLSIVSNPSIEELNERNENVPTETNQTSEMSTKDLGLDEKPAETEASNDSKPAEAPSRNSPHNEPKSREEQNIIKQINEDENLKTTTDDVKETAVAEVKEIGTITVNELTEVKESESNIFEKVHSSEDDKAKSSVDVDDVKLPEVKFTEHEQQVEADAAGVGKQQEVEQATKRGATKRGGRKMAVSESANEELTKSRSRIRHPPSTVNDLPNVADIVKEEVVEDPLVEEELPTTSTASITEKEEKPATVSTTKDEPVTESLIVEKQDHSSGLPQEEAPKVLEETHVPAKASEDAIKQTVRHGRRKQTVSESSQDSTHDEETATRRGRRRVLKTPVDKPLVEEKHESEKLSIVSNPSIEELNERNENVPTETNQTSEMSTKDLEMDEKPTESESSNDSKPAEAPSRNSPHNEPKSREEQNIIKQINEDENLKTTTDDVKETAVAEVKEIGTITVNELTEVKESESNIFEKAHSSEDDKAKSSVDVDDVELPEVKFTEHEQQVEADDAEVDKQQEVEQATKRGATKRGGRKIAVPESANEELTKSRSRIRHPPSTVNDLPNVADIVKEEVVEDPLVEEELPTTSTASITEKEEKPATVSTTKDEPVTESLIVEKQDHSSGLPQEEAPKVLEETHVSAKVSEDAIKQPVRHGRRKQTVSESTQDSTHDEETATRRGRRRVLKTPVDKPLVEEKHESETLSIVSNSSIEKLNERNEHVPKETNQTSEMSTKNLGLDEKPAETEASNDSIPAEAPSRNSPHNEQKPLVVENIIEQVIDEVKETVVSEVKETETITVNESEPTILQGLHSSQVHKTKSSVDGDDVKVPEEISAAGVCEQQEVEDVATTAKRATKRGGRKMEIPESTDELPKSRSRIRNRKSPTREPPSTVNNVPNVTEIGKEEVVAIEPHNLETIILSTAAVDEVVISNKVQDDHIEKNLKLKPTKTRGKRTRTASDASQDSVADEEPTKRRARQHKPTIPNVDEVIVEEMENKVDTQTANTPTTENLPINNEFAEKSSAEDTAIEKKDDELVEHPPHSIDNQEDTADKPQISVQVSGDATEHEAHVEEHEEQFTQIDTKDIVDETKNIDLTKVQITEVNLEPENQHTSPEVKEKEVRGRRGRQHVVAEDEHPVVKPATKRRAAAAKNVAADQESGPVSKRRVARRKQDMQQDEHIHTIHVTADDCKMDEDTSAETILPDEPKKGRVRRKKEEHPADLEHHETSEHGPLEPDEVPSEEWTHTESAGTSSKRRVVRRKQDHEQKEHDHELQVTIDDNKTHEEQSVDSSVACEEPKKGRSRKKKDEPKSRKRKESQTDNAQQHALHSEDHPHHHEQKDDETPHTPQRATAAPRRGRRASVLDVDVHAHIVAEGAEDTPSKRPLRKAATVYHNYDETSNDAVMPTKTKKKTDSPRKSLEASKSSPSATVTTALITVLASAPPAAATSTPSATTARGRTRKPTARVQQFLEEERAKAETPKKRGLLAAITDATDTPSPQRMPGRQGRKPTNIDAEVDPLGTPQASKRARGKVITHTEELETETAKVIEEKETDPTTPPAATVAPAAKGRRVKRKAKITAEEQHHNEDEPPPAKKSPLLLEAEKQESTPELEGPTPTRTAGRRGAATAAKARIEEDALAAAAIDPPKRARAKKPPTAKIVAAAIAAVTDTEGHSSEMDEEQNKAKSLKAEDLNSGEDKESDNIVEKPVNKRGARKVAASTSATDSPAVPPKRGRKPKAGSEATDTETPGEVKAARGTGRGRKNVHFDEIQAAEKAAETPEQQHLSPTEQQTSEESAAPAKRGTRTRRK